MDETNKLLDRIDSPADLQKLSLSQLPTLAKEIRECIISTVAETGGHLAANLGVVELTLALHYAFHTPTDKIYWDVGHQCYTHKLLTGRKARFSTLRQKDGISGFCNRNESPYDEHTSGHSSDSISLALGAVAARDLRAERYQVVAVIGDGSLTGGMALEALDHAGGLRKRMIVVLNDNEMSISGNVGAISRHLTHMRANPRYELAKAAVRNVLRRIPLLGNSLVRFISYIKKILKSTMLSGMFFENMGFVYLGPIDGHDVTNMVQVLQQAQQIERPVLLHIRTTKGKGYVPAETWPEQWHGTVPFHVETGLPKHPAAPGFSSVFGSEMTRLGAEDRRIVAITAAMEAGTGLQEFRCAYPSRFFDTAIAEQHAVGFAAGLAEAGLLPVLAIYSTFLQRAYDQLLENICLEELPVVLAIDRAGAVSSDGGTHQGIFDIAYLRAMPHMTLMAPADERELRAMLRFALKMGKPAAIRYPRESAHLLDGTEKAIRYGKGQLLRQGNDIAIVALGAMVQPALEAADLLAAQGIQASVINARFAAPIDGDLLREACALCKGKLLTVEDGALTGGFGEGVRSALAEIRDVQIETMALPTEFLPVDSRAHILADAGLDAAGISQRAETMLHGKE